MRIAIPTVNGRLSAHFGHCEAFTILDVDMDGKKIITQENVGAPPHEPGLLPRWLAEKGARLIIAGGMGVRAQNLFGEQGIAVLVGAPADSPEKIVTDYMDGILECGRNLCDH
ncbi:MAG: NifB/NifX family molybdenum-iron cluster-binding protein [Deltaproteobacteria bacterium]|nr:NifB/NifX family molybdenum-iron cluster-binding protein [Deltaproteobacteria bacterium]